MFDGGYELAELITLDRIMEELPEEHRQRFIKEYEEEDPEEWELYLEHRKLMNYPEL
jgi:hypothetical protein